jgi:hypothetical protein
MPEIQAGLQRWPGVLNRQSRVDFDVRILNYALAYFQYEVIS